MKSPDQGRSNDETAQAGLRELVERAQQGDRDVIPQLRQLLDTTPQLWLDASDLAAHAETAWVELIAGENELLAEGLRQRLEAMRDELAGTNHTPMERLLAQRIVNCWLQLQHGELTLAAADESSEQHLRFLSKRLDAAQNRYLAAMRAMTTLQRLVRKRG